MKLLWRGSRNTGLLLCLVVFGGCSSEPEPDPVAERIAAIKKAQQTSQEKADKKGPEKKDSTAETLPPVDVPGTIPELLALQQVPSIRGLFSPIYGPHPAGPLSDSARNYTSVAAQVCNASPPEPEPEIVPASFRDFANQALENGHRHLALEFGFAHLVVDYPASSPALRTAKFNATLQRPVWEVRFAVSLSERGDPFTAPLAAEGLPAVGVDDEEEPETEFESEMSSLQSNAESRAVDRDSDGQPVAATSERLSQGELDRQVGMLAMVLGDELQSRYQDGRFGSFLLQDNGALLQGVKSLNDELERERLEQVVDSADQLYESWRPGVVDLGRGSAEQALLAAVDANIDFLIHLDVLRRGSSELAYQTSRCRLIRVHDGKTLVLSRAVDSREADRLADIHEKRKRKYVESQLSRVIEMIDAVATVTELPKLNADRAKERLTVLLADGDARSLRTLAEIRLYQDLGFIDEREVEIAFEIAGGGDGLELLLGRYDRRAMLARKWAAN